MKFHFSLRIAHWLMAFVIVALLCSGLYMTELPKDDLYKYGLFYPMHKSFGILVIALVTLRIITRMITKAPALPDNFAKWEKILSGFSHFLLYLFMLMIPISGYVMSAASGRDVLFFGYKLPNLLEKNPDLGRFAHSMHKYVAYLIIALICLHVLALIWHYLRHKVNLLKRIW